MNEKGVGVVYVIFASLAALIAFIVWMQIYVPITNLILFPMLNNGAMVPHGVIAKGIIQLAPLILATMVLMKPVLSTEEE